MILAKPGIGPLEEWASRLVGQLDEQLRNFEQRIAALEGVVPVDFQTQIDNLQDDVDDINIALTAIGTPIDFVPTLSFGALTTGITYSTRDAQYVKIGCFVLYSGHITLTNNGSVTGNAELSLPFAVSTSVNGDNFAAGQIGFADNMTSGLPAVLRLPPGASRAAFYDGTSSMTDGDFANDAAFDFTIAYLTDA